MAKPVKFAHVLYQTRRYDEMIAWYEQVFEARMVHGHAAGPPSGIPEAHGFT